LAAVEGDAASAARPAKDRSAPRAAASVVVVRDGADGLELLLLRRAEKGDHNSGAWVFPGGLLDPGDRLCHAACSSLDDAAASALLSLPEGGLDYFVAAIRECFEECGLLFAADAQGLIPVFEDAPTLRDALQRGEREMRDLCGTRGLRLSTERLAYIGHWVTPLGRAKRFDVRFFVAVLPPGQVSTPDDGELTEQVWIRPSEALAGDHAMRLMSPTRAMIEEVASFADTRALWQWAMQPRPVRRILPRLASDASGLNPVHPDHPAWAEIGRLDPTGHGQAWRDLRPGVAVALSPRLVRVTLASGANAYLVGSEAGTCTLVDPADADRADDADHLALLQASSSQRIGHLLVLSSDGLARERATRLADRLRARPQVPPGGALQVLPGPDGASCLWWAEEATLFSGSLSPEAALSLARRAGCVVRWLAPGHGFLVAVEAGPDAEVA